MKSISTGLQNEFVKTNVKPIASNLFVYKKYMGRVTDFSFTNAVIVNGDATSLISAGDTVIFSHIEGIEEYTVGTIIYYDSEDTGDYPKKTAIIVESGGSSLELQNENNKAFVYKKYNLSTDILKEGIGDITYNLSGQTLNEVRVTDLNLKIENQSGDYWDENNNSGIFFKKVITCDTLGVSNDEITSINIPNETFNPLLGSKVIYFEGEATGKEYTIAEHDSLNRKIIVDGNPENDGVVAGLGASGDTFKIFAQSDYIVQLNYTLKGYEDEPISVFGGIIYPKDISYDPIKKIVRIKAFSFMKDFENNLAYKISKNSGQLTNIPGTVISYEQGNADYIEYSPRTLEYKFGDMTVEGAEGQSVRGVSYPGVKPLQFKTPNKIKYNGGNWLFAGGEGDLGLKSFFNVSCDFIGDMSEGAERPFENLWASINFDNYSLKCETDYILYNQETNKGIDEEDIEQGCPLIKFDGGKDTKAYSNFFIKYRRVNIDVSTEEVEYPINDEINDISHKYTERTFLEGGYSSSNNPCFYLGSLEKFTSFRITEILNTFETTPKVEGTWYYSLSTGLSKNGWEEFNTDGTFPNLTDGTNGFENDGIISFDMPSDWEKKGRIGDQENPELYWIRFVKTNSDIATPSNDIVSGRFYLHNRIRGKNGDFLNIELNREQLNSNNSSEDIYIVKDNENNPIVKSSHSYKKSFKLLKELTEQTGYNLGAVYNEDQFYFSLSNREISYLPKCPTNAEIETPEAICYYYDSTNGIDYLFVGIKNKIYRLNLEENIYELISNSPSFIFNGNFPERMFITDLVYSSECNKIFGIARLKQYPREIVYHADDSSEQPYIYQYHMSPGTIQFSISGLDSTPVINFPSSRNENTVRDWGDFWCENAPPFFIINSRWLYRTGFTRRGSLDSDNIKQMIGYLIAPITGVFPDPDNQGTTETKTYTPYTENIAIPFEQRIRQISRHQKDKNLIEGIWDGTVETKWSEPEVDSGVFEFMTSFQFEEQEDVNATLPCNLKRGFHNYFSWRRTTSDKTMGVFLQMSFGQDSPNCFWDKSDIVQSGDIDTDYDYTQHGWFCATFDYLNWDYPNPLTKYRIVNENEYESGGTGDTPSRHSEVLAIGEGYEKYDNTDIGDYVESYRLSNLLASCIGKNSLDEIIMTNYYCDTSILDGDIIADFDDDVSSNESAVDGIYTLYEDDYIVLGNGTSGTAYRKIRLYDYFKIQNVERDIQWGRIDFEYYNTSNNYVQFYPEVNMVSAVSGTSLRGIVEITLWESEDDIPTDWNANRRIKMTIGYIFEFSSFSDTPKYLTQTEYPIGVTSVEECNNETTIESLIVNNSSEEGYDFGKKYYYVNATSLFSEITTFNYPLTVAENDYFIFSDFQKFSRICIEDASTSDSFDSNGNLELYYFTNDNDDGDLENNANWTQIESHHLVYATGSVRSQNIRIIDFPLFRKWKLDSANMFSIKVKNVNSIDTWIVGDNTYNENVLLFKRKTLWTSKFNDYIDSNLNKHAGLVPINYEYDSTNDILYGSVLDRATLLWSTFYLDLGTARANSENQFGTGADNFIMTQNNLIPERLPKSFSYDSSDDTMYFVLTDPVKKEESPILYSIDYSGSELINTKLRTIQTSDDWDVVGDLTINETTGDVFGATKYENKTVWKYGEDAELRIPLLDWGTDTCKKAIKQFTQIIGSFATITSERIFKMFPLYKRTGSVDKTFTQEDIIEIKEIKEDKRYNYDGVEITWTDDDSNTGKEKKGITQTGKKVLKITNKLIKSSAFAKIVLKYIFPIFVQNKRKIKFIASFPPVIEVGDIIDFDLPTRLTEQTDLSSDFVVDKITISDKKRQLKIEATEK